jgi:hypothetical protein
MTAVSATHAGKAVVQVAAVQVAIDHLADIGPERIYSAWENSDY